jgi:bisphosphoglycerate-dependent phosphoglycerate mutase family 1
MSPNLRLLLFLASSIVIESFSSSSSNGKNAPIPIVEHDSNTDINNNNPVHTLLLCRHGDSIWNGGQPGTQETFTGWTDVPLSQKGMKEASNTGKEVSSYSYGIDACFTSTLGRAKETAHHCLWAFSEQPYFTHPQKYVSDYRLNERHYGALQGYVKHEVENGLMGYDPELVKQWRRNWYAVPPLLEDDDLRRIQEVKKFRNFCGGADNVPRGESLEMVATNRIRPFLDDVLSPIMDEASIRKRQQQQQEQHYTNHHHSNHNNSNNILQGTEGGNNQGGTGLIIAHANSLRALIGVICQVEKDEVALQKLEAMKIQTGVPLIMKYQRTNDGSYQPCVISEIINGEGNGPGLTPDLPIWPLSCLPKRNSRIQDDLSFAKYSLGHQELDLKKRLFKKSSNIRIDVI